MPARHRSRESALQVLFQWDVRRIPVEDAIAAFYETLHSEEDQPARSERDPFMEELVTGTVGAVDELDKRIAAKSENWRIDRMAAVDRNVLRLAIYEMTALKTPAAVVMDEAIELARRFAGDESVRFVNGVLDAVHRDAPPAP